MNVWIVVHPYDGRSWCKVRVRPVDQSRLNDTPAYIWAEWREPFEQDQSGCIIPRMPDTEHHYASNVDPLVIGQHMYFDYCKKGRRKRRLTNLGPPNRLKRDDIILFMAMRTGAVFVDTVFVVGECRPWGAEDIPWKEGEADTLARRVHFHPFAHGDEHPEVHVVGRNNVAARSYRGRRHEGSNAGDESSALFCWVPFKRGLDDPSPMKLTGRSGAFKQLERIYGRGTLQRPRQAFQVALIESAQGQELFRELREDAERAGFGVAVQVALLSNEVRPVKSSMKASLKCSAWQCASPSESKAICRARKVC